MSTSKKSDDRKNIVIVGGGGYGAGLARDLSAKLDASRYNITLVSTRPYYIHLVAAVRFTVTAEGKLEDRALIPLDQLFINNNGNFILGKVSTIKENGEGLGGEVVLEDGENVPYDTLILATGNVWSGHLGFPDKEEDVRAWVASWRSKFSAAKEIVFVGGGPVAVETAGEVIDTFPNKTVTIVHSEEQLLNNVYPAKFRKYLTEKVAAKGINLVLNDRLESIPAEDAIGVKTQNGKSLPNADLIVPTFGGRPNTAFISTLGSDVLNERGLVKVNPTLEVPGHPGVFAIGDIIDWNEQKQLGKAGGQIGTVIANIQSFFADQPLTKVYKSMPEMIVVPIGKTGGASYFDVLWGITLGDFFTRLIKGGDLLVSMYRKKFGLPA